MYPATKLLIGLVLVLASAACAQTDAGITTSVKAQLAADDDVKVFQINVETNNKVVTLSGAVDTARAKSRAVEIARGTDGVANVVDKIQVTGATEVATETYSPDRAMFSDTALTAGVKGKLAGDPMVSALAIDVDTENQIVTLTGDVRTNAERQRAVRLAREVAGVKDVVDRLTVKP